MQITTWPYTQARLRQARMVDLRSPTEYLRDHIPGAVNVPLFDDAARALVGTLYHKESPEKAYDAGLEIAAARMPELLATVLGRAPDEAWRRRFQEIAGPLREGQEAVSCLPPAADEPMPDLFLHCWRGGMRSRSVAMLLQRLGVRVGLLEGGYKSYRHWVRDRLAAWPPAPTAAADVPWFVLVSGATGTGKTLLLRRLEEAEPGSTLDLEGLADHRSSILGAVGREPVSQPMFESLLAARLDALGPPPWFVEAESRKVGDIILPEGLYRSMRAAPTVVLEAEVATRVAILVEDYTSHPDSHAQIAAQLPFLEKRLGGKWVGELGRLLEARDYAEVARILLERYYDPRYDHSGADLRPVAHLRVEDPGLDDRLRSLRDGLRQGGG